MITMKSWLRMTCFLTLAMGTASGSVYAEDASVLKCSVTEVADDGSIKFNDDNLSVEINKDFSVQTPAGKTVKFSTEDGTFTIDIETGPCDSKKESDVKSCRISAESSAMPGVGTHLVSENVIVNCD
jgi:hypothetical protein